MTYTFYYKLHVCVCVCIKTTTWEGLDCSGISLRGRLTKKKRRITLAKERWKSNQNPEDELVSWLSLHFSVCHSDAAVNCFIKTNVGTVFFFFFLIVQFQLLGILVEKNINIYFSFNRPINCIKIIVLKKITSLKIN